MDTPEQQIPPQMDLEATFDEEAPTDRDYTNREDQKDELMLEFQKTPFYNSERKTQLLAPKPRKIDRSRTNQPVMLHQRGNPILNRLRKARNPEKKKSKRASILEGQELAIRLKRSQKSQNSSQGDQLDNKNTPGFAIVYGRTRKAHKTYIPKTGLKQDFSSTSEEEEKDEELLDLSQHADRAPRHSKRFYSPNFSKINHKISRLKEQGIGLTQSHTSLQDPENVPIDLAIPSYDFKFARSKFKSVTGMPHSKTQNAALFHNPGAEKATAEYYQPPNGVYTFKKSKTIANPTKLSEKRKRDLLAKYLKKSSKGLSPRSQMKLKMHMIQTFRRDKETVLCFCFLKFKKLESAFMTILVNDIIFSANVCVLGFILTLRFIEAIPGLVFFLISSAAYVHWRVERISFGLLFWVFLVFRWIFYIIISLAYIDLFVEVSPLFFSKFGVFEWLELCCACFAPNELTLFIFSSEFCSKNQIFYF